MKMNVQNTTKPAEQPVFHKVAENLYWLEPFQNWIKTARIAGKIAIAPSLQQKRVLALEVFGSNLFLDCKKPVVLASNRGRYSSNQIKLVEWCAIQGSNL